MKKNNLIQKILTLAMLLGATGLVNAQSKVGQNPISINSNAVFELEHNSKGMLLPRLALTSTAASAPMTAHVAGMTVYNTATVSDVTPGFYYNDGTKWVRLASAGTGAGSLTNANGIIVTGGTGATFSNASLRLDSTAIAKMLGQSPVKDSLTSVVNNQITAGSITGQDLSAGTLLITTGTPTGALLKTAGYRVDTNALKTFIINNAPGVTANNTTAGNLVTVTNGTGATLTAMTVAVDTTALKAFVSARTTNTLTNPTNTITSTVNGIAATAPAVNTVANAFNTTTRALTTTVNGVAGTAITLTDGLDSTTASNGLTLTGKDVRLGGALTAATTITTTATNTLALAGLQSGSTADSLVMIDGTTGVIKRMSTTKMSDKTQANNGLSKSGDTVQLGGALTKATTITGAANTLAITSTATNGFSVDGTTFSVDAANNRVGVGTATPTSTFEVNGSATNTTAFNAGAGTAINFALSNLAYTTSSAAAFTLSGMKDGGTYTLAVQGATAGTSSFSHAGLTFRQVNNAATTASKHTLYTFIVMGANVYYWMNAGF